MISVEQEIDKFYDETEKSVEHIIDGSDEHLDLILSITNPLNKISSDFQRLNENLYSSFKNYSNEQLEGDVMSKMKRLNKLCMTLIGALRTSYLYRDVRVALRNFTRNHDLLREMIHDLQNLRLAKDDEFDALLNDLNNL